MCMTCLHFEFPFRYPPKDKDDSLVPLFLFRSPHPHAKMKNQSMKKCKKCHKANVLPPFAPVVFNPSGLAASPLQKDKRKNSIQKRKRRL